MRSLTLNRGSGQNSIAGSGTHYQSGYHKVYTLTGTTGVLKGGKTPVGLKLVYTGKWQFAAMTGHFDPEENSFRGTVTWQGGNSGEFVFKHDPDFVRFYPAPSTIDARARWKFATAVILDRIRRESWSASYILKRIKDGKRYTELAVKDMHSRKTFDGGELDEYHNLLSSIYEADARFYTPRINFNIKQSEVIIQYVSGDLFLIGAHPREYSDVECDSCSTTLEGARILCIDCHFNNTLDLCSKPECLDSVITPKRRPGLEAPHTPNHDMLKVRQIIFDRDVARTKKKAGDALEAARNTLSDLETKELPTPGCVRCRNVISLPCWYCADCTGEIPQDFFKPAPCSSDLFV